MDCLYHFQSIDLKHYTVKPETLTSFMIDVFNQSNLGNILTLRNANASSVAIYACKSSNCNSALIIASITMRSPLNNFIILAHKVVLTAKTSDEV